MNGIAPEEAMEVDFVSADLPLVNGDIHLHHINKMRSLCPFQVYTRNDHKKVITCDKLPYFSNHKQIISSQLKSLIINSCQVSPAVFKDRLLKLQEKAREVKRFYDKSAFLYITPLEKLKGDPILRKPIWKASSASLLVKQKDDEEVAHIENISSKYSGKLKDGPVTRPALVPGARVYGMISSLEDKFALGVVQSITEGEREQLVQVKFEAVNSFVTRLFSLRQLAYVENPDVKLPVGTRVLAQFEGGVYAGIIAERLSPANNHRYLIFFDDGYAQYFKEDKVYLMCGQSKDITEDVHENIKAFVKLFLQRFPEVPKLRIQKGDITKTEFEDKWYDTKVLDTDCSMLKMLFLASGRTEWIYRGSTRLKALYDEISNAKAKVLSGKTSGRQSFTARKLHQPYIEYTREEITLSDDDDPGEGQHFTARRRTGVLPPSAESGEKKSKNTARKSTANQGDFQSYQGVQRYPDYASHQGYKDIHSLVSYHRSSYVPHQCGPFCKERFDLSRFRNVSPYLIPLKVGWERQIRKYRSKGQQCMVLYRSPCGRHLRNMFEIQKYLLLVASQITIDLFTIDTNVEVYRTFRPKEKLFYKEDITEGKEKMAVSCVNRWSNEAPIYIEYAAERFPSAGVENVLNLERNFLCGCSCTDNCQNSARCTCQRMTNYACYGKPYGDAGYKYRRLQEPIQTGIYECNDKCSCGPQCGNRVIQNGLKVRLQMFQTERKGWGIRCLDDIDSGQFICIYAGQLLTEAEADLKGKKFGDEYLADLDFINISEQKEGYESDVSNIEDTEEIKEKYIARKQGISSPKKNQSSSPSPSSSGSDLNALTSDSDSDYELQLRSTANTSYTRRSIPYTGASKSTSVFPSSGIDNSKDAANCLPNVTTPLDSFSFVPRPLSPADLELVEKIEFTRSPILNENVRSVARKSSSKQTGNPTTNNTNSKISSVCAYYGDNRLIIMDAKTKGNIGRYLNHSCSPNVFVQNVFVKTHDLRFPEIAFFAQHHIMAGIELTWDYNYDVNSVPERVMYCYCDSRNCRGRLL